FRALVGKTKHSIKHYVEDGFSDVAKGRFIQQEKQAKEYVMRNIKESTNTKANLINKMRYFEQDTDLELTLENFLNHYHLSVYDFYGKSANRSFQRMKVAAGVAADFECDMEKEITKRLPKLFHLNSEKLLAFLMRYVEARGTLIPENDEERLMITCFTTASFKRNLQRKGSHLSRMDLSQCS